MRALARLASLSAREQILLAATGALTALVLVGRVTLAVRDDLEALRARVTAHERELGQVRRAAATLRRTSPPPARGETDSLLTRLETAALGVVDRARIAGMTPAAGPVEDGLAEERIEIRVSGASLAETVELVHAFEAARPPLQVARLELRKHPDDPGRFEATVEVSELRPAP